MDIKISRIHKSLEVSSRESLAFEVIAFFSAFMLHNCKHVSTVSSRHIAVALQVPEETTGIYFTKLFSLQAFLIVIGSLLTFIIKWFSTDFVLPLSLFCSLLVFIARLIVFFVVIFSKNLAVHFYCASIFESFCMGLFYIPFCSLTPQYTSVLSLGAKLSKFSVFLFQLLMDLMIYQNPKLMVRIHFSIILVLTFFSTILWFYYCLFNVKDTFSSETSDTDDLDDETERLSYFNLLKIPDTKPSQPAPFEEIEPSYASHIKNCISPFFMCIITLALNNMIIPGLLPYALLERDKCHSINMFLAPSGLLGCLLVHILKKKVPSVNFKWKKRWHFFWFFAIPPFIVTVLTFVALHTETTLSRSIRGSQLSVICMALFFIFCHPAIETLGFVGIVANVKHNKKLCHRGIRIIATNQFLSSIVGFMVYKISVGYNVTRKLNYITPEATALGRSFWYWVSSSITSGFKDLMSDFKLNIKPYL